MECAPSQRRRLAAIARHLTDSSSLHSLAYENLNLRSKPRDGAPVVIGGMVMDIQATPTGGRLIRGSTTPGQVRYVRGGVARNVAESMALLETPPFLISVVGDDVAGDSMVSHWKSLGLSVDGICRCKGATTPVVSAVFDKQGELAAAVADTSTVEEHLTPEWINRFADVIKGAPILMLDANLLPSAMEAACKLAKEANVPVWFEPVSVAKSVRASKFLHLMTYASPNESELVAMAESLYQNGTKRPLDDDDEGPPENNLPEPAASVWQMRHSVRALLDTGLKYIILTMGSHGAVLCSTNSHPSRKAVSDQGWTVFLPVCVSPRPVQKNREGKTDVSYIQFPALPASVLNLSGAGDCLVAGALAALSSSTDMERALAYGVSASKWAVESDSNVYQDLSHNLVSEGAKKVASRARQLLM